MKIKYYNLFIKYFSPLFCILIFNFTNAQSKNAYFHELNIQGIPFNKKVNILFEDSIGYLWIGTNTGLYKYDGNSLVGYQNNVFVSHSLPNNTINSIIEDADKNLWIGSESYLIHYNRKENKFKGFYKNNTFTVFKKTSNSNIWVNSKNIGLLSIKPNKDKKEIDLPLDNYKIIKINKQINTFIEDNFNRYWIGTPNGLYVINNNKFMPTDFKKNIKAVKSFGNNQFIAITNKDLYVLSYNKSNYSLEILEQYLDIMNPFSEVGLLNNMVKNPYNETLWIGSSQGLIKATRKNNSYTFSIYSQGKSKGELKNDQISSVLFDSYNNLWISTSKGINKKLGRTSVFEFNKITTNNNLKNIESNTIISYNSNTVLVASENGIYNYNPKSKEYKKIQIPLSGVVKIAFNYEKNKLFIANGGTLYETDEYTPNKSKLNTTKLASYEGRISDIAVINSNEICIGIWGKGIKIINKKNEISEFKKQAISKLKNTHISVLLLTSDNKLWVGTRGEGLFELDFNKETIKEFLASEREGLTSNGILSIFEDSKKNIWIGTRGGGLNKYLKTTNNFAHFNSSNNSYLDTSISDIQEDSKGNIWLSTKDGLVYFDVANKKFIPFRQEDGIEESEFAFNSSSSNKNKDILYFGCSEGFYSVHISNFIQKKLPPSTVITNFSILGETIKNDDTTQNNLIKLNSNPSSVITLPYDQNNIVFNFSSLDLTTPSKNQYAYMLEGLNDYWVYTNASNRNANYNNLPPGTYTFKVKSSNSDGVWNKTPTTLKFVIKPPFWKSPWAIFCYWLLIAIIIFISSKLVRRWYQLKKNLVKETISREKDNEHNMMKMVFFTDISHELRTPLSLILGTIEKVVKEKKFILSPLTAQRIYNNSLRMHRLINQIMDIRKFDVGQYKLCVSKNDIVKDVSIIKDSFNDFARIYKIKYDFISEEDKITGWFDVDILEKTLFNILSNAFKYTKENDEISVKLELIKKKDTNSNTDLDLEKNTYIKCSVKDNGIGIPKKDLPFIFDRYYQSTKSHSNQIPGTGIGMELVHKLIEKHYGIITVDSEENIFTEFTFYLPINKEQYTKDERIKNSMPLKRSFIENSEFKVIDEVTTDFNNQKIIQKNNNKQKVLIVEDNLELRTMIKEELSEEFIIMEAENGEEGYQIILKEKPLLIISDILMPIEDGISMLKRIKNNPEISNIPIFMLTAKNSDETKIECLSLGSDDYIEKPFSLEFVKWKVKNTLTKQTELKERYSKVITAEPSEINIDSNDEKFIKRLIQIIENSMDDNLLSVEYLASEIGMSRANLYRKLQAIINDTPVNFIKTIRLKRAAQLLKKSDLYISEIAYMTGFNNQKYFGKCFHKEYGMSPTEYIKKYSENGFSK
ncbi:Signal transduction histidine kinase [Flavobacterium flevense]|uniref:histidine kinase n=1 Tax=Flavobacterium flevense TaxID=983 RepID=A0A4Y4AZL8_9FLAO|nr:two-component regulator propeller domain-containing protein [Flavobacterium flevense]GEC72769.1 hybrid sensor histidine kinase/response regulator [Flavobacterium flevense]SHM16554.1 Signal transduction histidine kinase [Flavobacterium flevense]